MMRITTSSKETKKLEVTSSFEFVTSGVAVCSTAQRVLFTSHGHTVILVYSSRAALM